MYNAIHNINIMFYKFNNKNIKPYLYSGTPESSLNQNTMYTLSAAFGEETSQGNLTDLPSTASTGTSGTVTVT